MIYRYFIENTFKLSIEVFLWVQTSGNNRIHFSEKPWINYIKVCAKRKWYDCFWKCFIKYNINLDFWKWLNYKIDSMNNIWFVFYEFQFSGFCMNNLESSYRTHFVRRSLKPGQFAYFVLEVWGKTLNGAGFSDLFWIY